MYHTEPAQYLRMLPVDGVPEVSSDLAIIEFDDQGQLWQPRQLDDTVTLIRRRNTEARRGVLVVVFMHGWQNNADLARDDKDLVEFRHSLTQIARSQHQHGAPLPDRVVGVYLGWRGASSRLPLIREMTFWGRKQAGDRMVSLNTRETLLRVMQAAQQRPGSKCIVAGHSMGGMIVGEALASSLSTLIMLQGDKGLRLPADLVVLINPARDALDAWQFIDFLKRSGAQLQLRDQENRVIPAGRRPMMISITSEADTATRIAYPLGRSIKNLAGSFRQDHGPGEPSQREMTVHTEGHIDRLVSHHASLVDGEVRLTAVPGAYNDTPFWVIRTTRDICHSHDDVNNPNLQDLLDQIIAGNRTYDAGVQPILVTEAVAGKAD